MQADYPVLLDACVLVNQPVVDLLLRLSEEPRLLLPKWSDLILVEVERTLFSWKHWQQNQMVAKFINVLRSEFPEALLTSYEDLIPLMENNEKDRHVLAAAVKGKIELIVTFNVKDFPPKSCEKWGVEAQHPQDYLITMFLLKPNRVIQSLDAIAKYRKESREDILLRLGKHVPKFSSMILGV